MKIVFSKSDLLNGVNIVQKAVPSKTTMNILECILIDASSDIIKFTANDMELGIETRVKGNIIEKGIVAIDANEIWYGEGDDLFSPSSGANHAVEVIGIDYSDPDHPMVILNDSGSPNGKGEMVPLGDFMDAWKDGECQMIKCYPKK